MYRDPLVAVVTPIDTQISCGFTSAPPRLFCEGNGMLSTATVDSQLIVSVTTPIRLHELAPGDNGQPNCEFNKGEKKTCCVEGVSKI